MTGTARFDAGGYRYIPGPFQYSGGVRATGALEIVRVRFARPLAVAEGFAAIEAHLAARGRPLTSFCACELRSPAPFTEAGFRDFNRLYVGTLERWGIFRDERNPVARSNVCPELDPPQEPVFEAFSHTTARAAGAADAPSFVVAGSGEAREGGPSYAGRIVRQGDTSTAGLREKVRYVMGEMERRMAALGVGWRDASATQIYTVHDIHPLLAEEVVSRGAAAHGVTWHHARPPVEGLDYEMDVRGVRLEETI